MAVDPVNIPRTAVPAGLVDPVASARAELKAALLAIEDKTNVPRQLQKAGGKARVFAQRNPVGAFAAVVGVAAVVGGVVWAVARSIAR
ncbi:MULTISPECIES: hypothetical protein [unclassified Microbacterium]|uniref:hypothetical protein n=1 Tax=unclassified Microbacterium TaxID=2609290 RepID=UPI001ACC6D21|nr:hypothetical protein [Microbacterium sp.]MBN9157091.1 hypothetical protein [Microbacterium sp.]MBS1898322.1 hypothetical protein [Actinomycetota bacterium]